MAFKLVWRRVYWKNKNLFSEWFINTVDWLFNFHAYILWTHMQIYWTALTISVVKILGFMICILEFDMLRGKIDTFRDTIYPIIVLRLLSISSCLFMWSLETITLACEWICRTHRKARISDHSMDLEIRFEFIPALMAVWKFDIYLGSECRAW